MDSDQKCEDSGNPKSSANRRSKRAKKRYGEFNVESLDQFPYRSDSLTLLDAEEVARQLGYIPTNLVEIGSYDKKTRKPQTLILYGLNQNNKIKGRYATGKLQPFPTMVWMSCPELKSQISKLEVDGLVDLFEEKLNDGNTTCAVGARASTGEVDAERDRQFLDRMYSAHRAYADERWNRFSEEHRDYIERHGWVENLRDVGIAGINAFNHVKCLHCHYAHFLARPQHGNVIGQWVHEEMERRGFVLPNGTGECDGKDDGSGSGESGECHQECLLPGDSTT